MRIFKRGIQMLFRRNVSVDRKRCCCEVVRHANLVTSVWLQDHPAELILEDTEYFFTWRRWRLTGAAGDFQESIVISLFLDSSHSLVDYENKRDD